MVDPTIFKHELAVGATALSDDVQHSIPHLYGAVILLWILFAVMLVGGFVFAILSWRIPADRRIYHYISVTVMIISAISYFSMATYSGALLQQADKHVPPSLVTDVYMRIWSQSYWTRFIDALITMPMILFMLSMLAGMDATSTFGVTVASIVMVCSCFSSISGQNAAAIIGWIAFAVLAHLLIFHQTLVHGRRLAKKRGPTISRFYTAIAAYAVAIMLGYVIFWASIAARGEIEIWSLRLFPVYVAVCALFDVLLKSVFGAWLVYAHAKIPDLGSGVGDVWFHQCSDEGQIRIGEEAE